MANFNSLPITVHANILYYIATPPWISAHPENVLSGRYYKAFFYENVVTYQSLNHAWRYLIQEQMWNTICITLFEVSQLREFLTANPALGRHTRALDVRSPVDSISTASLTPPNTLLDELAGDTKEGLLIFQIWSEVIEIINLYLQFGNLQELCFFPGFLLNQQRMDPHRIINFPGRGCIPVVRNSQIKCFRSNPESVYSGDLLGGVSIGRIVECISAGLEELHLEVLMLEIGDRRARRATYVGITQLATNLPHLSPNLTTLNLRYSNYKPESPYKTKLYSYTHLDNNEDLLSRALRILSKKLVNFTYIDGRISEELFLPSSTTTESPEWPHLKQYMIRFCQVASDGTWRHDFKGTDALGNSPLHIPPLDGMNATDPDYIDLLDDGDDNVRTIPNRVLVDAIFETASRAMVPNMPMIECWGVALCGESVYMDIKLELGYDEKGNRRVKTGKTFKHKKETMKIWSEWFGKEALEHMDEEQNRDEGN